MNNKNKVPYGPTQYRNVNLADIYKKTAIEKKNIITSKALELPKISSSDLPKILNSPFNSTSKNINNTSTSIIEDPLDAYNKAVNIKEQSKQDNKYYPGYLPVVTKDNPITSDRYKYYPNNATKQIQEFLNYYFAPRTEKSLDLHTAGTTELKSLTVDGIFGDTTKQRLALYQKENGLNPTGIFDATTREKMAATSFSKEEYNKRIKYAKWDLERKYPDVFKKAGDNTGNILNTYLVDYGKDADAKTQRQLVEAALELRDTYQYYRVDWYNSNSEYYDKDLTDVLLENDDKINKFEETYKRELSDAGIADPKAKDLTDYQKNIVANLRYKYGIDLFEKEKKADKEYEDAQKKLEKTLPYYTSIYSNDFILLGNDDSNVYDGTTIVAVNAEDYKYVTCNEDETDKRGYFIRLYNGKYSYLTKDSTQIIKSKDAQNVSTKYTKDKNGKFVIQIIVPDNYDDKYIKNVRKQALQNYNYNAYAAHMNKIYEVMDWISTQKKTKGTAPRSALAAVAASIKKSSDLNWITNQKERRGAAPRSGSNKEHTWSGDIQFRDEVYYDLSNSFSDAVKAGDKEAFFEKYSKSSLEYKDIDKLWEIECQAYEDYLRLFKDDVDQKIRSNPFAYYAYDNYAKPISEGNIPIMNAIIDVCDELDILAKPAKIEIAKYIYNFGQGPNLLNVTNEQMFQLARHQLSYDYGLGQDIYYDLHYTDSNNNKHPALLPNLALEIFSDPLTYFSLGMSSIGQAIGETVGKKVAGKFAKEVSEELAEEAITKIGKKAVEDISLSYAEKVLKESSQEAIEKRLMQYIGGSDSVRKATAEAISKEIAEENYTVAAKQLVSISEDLSNDLFKAGLSDILDSAHYTDFFREAYGKGYKRWMTEPSRKSLQEHIQEATSRALKKYAKPKYLQNLAAETFGKVTPEVEKGLVSIADYTQKKILKQPIEATANNIVKGVAALSKGSEYVQKYLSGVLISALSGGIFPIGLLTKKVFGKVKAGVLTKKYANATRIIKNVKDALSTDKTLNILEYTPEKIKDIYNALAICNELSAADFGDDVILSSDYISSALIYGAAQDLQKVSNIVLNPDASLDNILKDLCLHAGIDQTDDVTIQSILEKYKDKITDLLDDTTNVAISGRSLLYSEDFVKYLKASADNADDLKEFGKVYALIDDTPVEVKLSGEVFEDANNKGFYYYMLKDSNSWVPEDTLYFYKHGDLVKEMYEKLNKLSDYVNRKVNYQTCVEYIPNINKAAKRLTDIPAQIKASTTGQLISLFPGFTAVKTLDYAKPMTDNVLKICDESNAILDEAINAFRKADIFSEEEIILVSKMQKAVNDLKRDAKNIYGKYVAVSEYFKELHEKGYRNILKGILDTDGDRVFKAVFTNNVDFSYAIKNFKNAVDTGDMTATAISFDVLNKILDVTKLDVTHNLERDLNKVLNYAKKLREDLKVKLGAHAPLAKSYQDLSKKIIKYPTMFASEKITKEKAIALVDQLLSNIGSSHSNLFNDNIVSKDIIKEISDVKKDLDIINDLDLTKSSEILKAQTNLVLSLKPDAFLKNPEAFAKYKENWLEFNRVAILSGAVTDPKAIKSFNKLNPANFLSDVMRVTSDGMIRQLKLSKAYIACTYYGNKSITDVINIVNSDSYLSNFIQELSLIANVTSDKALKHKYAQQILAACQIKDASRAYKTSMNLLNAITQDNALPPEVSTGLIESIMKYADDSIDNISFEYPKFLDKIYNNIEAYNGFRYQVNSYSTTKFLSDEKVIADLESNYKKPLNQIFKDNDRDLVTLDSVMHTHLNKEFSNDDAKYVLVDLETNAATKNSSMNSIYEIKYKNYRENGTKSLKRYIPTTQYVDENTGAVYRKAVNKLDEPTQEYIAKRFPNMSITEGYNEFYKIYSDPNGLTEKEMLETFMQDLVKVGTSKEPKLVFQNSDKFNPYFLHTKFYELDLNDSFYNSIEKFDVRQMLSEQDGIKLLTPGEKEHIHSLLSNYVSARQVDMKRASAIIAWYEGQPIAPQTAVDAFFRVPDETFADDLNTLAGVIGTIGAENRDVSLLAQSQNILKNCANDIYNTSYNISMVTGILNKCTFEDTLRSSSQTLYTKIKKTFYEYVDKNADALTKKFNMSVEDIKQKFGQTMNLTKSIAGLGDNVSPVSFRNIADFKTDLRVFPKLKVGQKIAVNDLVKMHNFTEEIMNNANRLSQTLASNSPKFEAILNRYEDALKDAVNKMNSLMLYIDPDNSAIYKNFDVSKLSAKEALVVYNKYNNNQITRTLIPMIEDPFKLIELLEKDADELPDSVRNTILDIVDKYMYCDGEHLAKCLGVNPAKDLSKYSYRDFINDLIELSKDPDVGLSKAASRFKGKNKRYLDTIKCNFYDYAFEKAKPFKDISNETVNDIFTNSIKGYSTKINLVDMDEWAEVTAKVTNPDSAFVKNIDALTALDETGFFKAQQQALATSLESAQRLVKATDSLFDALDSTKNTRSLQNIFVQAQEDIYKTQVIDRLIAEPKNLKNLMIYNSPWFEFSKADLVKGSRTKIAYETFLKNKKAFEETGISFLEVEDRVYVYLTDFDEISYTFNKDTNTLQAFKGDELIERLPMTEYNYKDRIRERIINTFKKKSGDTSLPEGVGIATENFVKAWDAAQDSLKYLSHGANIGSVGDVITKDTVQSLYDQLPDAIKEAIDIDKFLDDSLWTQTRFNFINLGTSASRRLKDPTASTSLITSTIRASENAAAKAPAKLQYTTMFFDPKLNIKNMKYSDVDLFNYLHANPEFSLAILTESKKAPLGYKVNPIKVNSVADITAAKELNATIVPTNAFSKVMDSINGDFFTEGFFKFYKRVLYLYKVGYLINPGTALRNFEDGLLRNANELGASDAFKYPMYAQELVRKYDRATEELIKLGNGRFAYEQLPYYFGNINKELDLETYQLLNAFFQEPSSSGLTAAWSKYYKQLNSNDVRGTWEIFSEGIGKALNPMSKVEEINRLSLFLGLVDRGYTNSEIFQKITKSHFDYNTKSQGVRILEMFIPFYTFTANNLTYWIDYFAMHPDMLRNYIRAYNTIWNEEDMEDSAYNPSLEYQILNGNTKLSEGIVLKTGFSFMGAFNLLTDPVDTLKGSLFEPYANIADAMLSSANIPNAALRDYLGVQDVYNSSQFRQDIESFVANNDKQGYIDYCTSRGVSENTLEDNWEREKKNYIWKQDSSDEHWYNQQWVNYVPGVGTVANRISQSFKYFDYTQKTPLALASDIFGAYKLQPKYQFDFYMRHFNYRESNLGNWKRYEDKKSKWTNYKNNYNKYYSNYLPKIYPKISYPSKSYVKQSFNGVPFRYTHHGIQSYRGKLGAYKTSRIPKSYASKSYAKKSYKAKKYYTKKFYLNTPGFYSRKFTPNKYTTSQGKGLNRSLFSRRFIGKYYNKDGTSKMDNRSKTYTPKYLRYRISDMKYYYKQ